MHDSSSGVLVALAWLMIRPPSAGAPLAKRIECSRRKAFVHSSMAITALSGRSPRQLCSEEVHSLVEVEVDRAMEVIGRQGCQELLVFPHRGEEVWPLVVNQHDGDGLLEVRTPGVGQRPDRPGGVHDIGVAEQHQCVQTLFPHGSLHSGHPVSAHAGEVGLDGIDVGGATAISPAGIRRPLRDSA